MRHTLLGALIAVILIACGAGSTSPTAELPTSTEATTTIAISTTSSAVETTTTAAAATTTTAQPVPLVRVANGAKVEGLDTLSVRVGEPVVFEVVSDSVDEVHVHGFDLYFDVTPGQRTRVEFIADATGIFEVEMHHTSLRLLDIEVTP